MYLEVTEIQQDRWNYLSMILKQQQQVVKVFIAPFILEFMFIFVCPQCSSLF